jgi:RNA polymerase sigma-70 factor (ECF subfamily)
MPVSKPAMKGSRAEANERLLVQAAQKDASRFADLYELHFDAIYAFIARRIRDRDLSEDLTSDVFHKALAALPRFDWRGVPFGVWLLRIASNVVIDQWKRSAQAAPGDLPEPATKQDFDEALRCARLFRLVDQLPQDQRRVLQMRFSEGNSIREIAGALKKTDGAVKQLQFRAFETLRAQTSEAVSAPPSKKKSGTRHG